MSYGEHTFAFFTNEHSACYILTQNQLRKAIDSGGFLVEPHQGDYDLLCSAATDPYTQCGFKKMVCISHLDDFMIHHLPNAYSEKLGISWEEFHLQTKALMSILNEKRKEEELFGTKTKLPVRKYDKSYFEKCRDDILKLVPTKAKNVLSVGCGWGVTEEKLVKNNVHVVGIPIDHVIAESAKSRGVEVLCPNLEVAKNSIELGFDCILFSNVFQYLPDPVKILKDYAEKLNKGGRIILSIPNFSYVRIVYDSVRNKRICSEKGFDKLGMHLTNVKSGKKWSKQCGLKIIHTEYVIEHRYKTISALSLGLLDKYLAKQLLFVLNKT